MLPPPRPRGRRGRRACPSPRCASLPANSNPCEHAGRCVNTDGAFHCECLRGYAGPRCEMDVNECHSDPCQNDATCLDKIGGFTCLCMPGAWRIRAWGRDGRPNCACRRRAAWAPCVVAPRAPSAFNSRWWRGAQPRGALRSEAALEFLEPQRPN